MDSTSSTGPRPKLDLDTARELPKATKPKHLSSQAKVTLGDTLTRQQLVDLLFKAHEEFESAAIDAPNIGLALEALLRAEDLAKSGKNKQAQAIAGNVLAGFVSWTVSFGVGDWTSRLSGNPWAGLIAGGLAAGAAETLAPAVRNQGAVWSSPSHTAVLKTIHLTNEYRTARIAGHTRVAAKAKEDLNNHLADVAKKYPGWCGAERRSFLVNELPFTSFTVFYLAQTAATIYLGLPATSWEAFALKALAGLLSAASTMTLSHALRARFDPGAALTQGNTGDALLEKVVHLQAEKKALEVILAGVVQGDEREELTQGVLSTDAVAACYTNPKALAPRIRERLNACEKELGQASSQLEEAAEKGLVLTDLASAVGTNAANNVSKVVDDERVCSWTNTGRYVARTVAMTAALATVAFCAFEVQQVVTGDHLNTTAEKLDDPGYVGWNLAGPGALIFGPPPFGWAFRYIVAYRATMAVGSVAVGLVKRAFMKERAPLAPGFNRNASLARARELMDAGVPTVVSVDTDDDDDRGGDRKGVGGKGGPKRVNPVSGEEEDDVAIDGGDDSDVVISDSDEEG